MGLSIDAGIIYMPGQIFIFNAMMYVTDSTGHLGLVENFSPGRVIRFGNLEYIADLHSELVLQRLVSCRAQEQQVRFLDPLTIHGASSLLAGDLYLGVLYGGHTRSKL